MKARLLIIAATALLLAGCGQAPEVASEAFDRSFSESCNASAVTAGAPAEAASTLCACGLRKINERYSAAEKVTLSEEQVQPLVQECVAEVVQQNG